MPRQQTFSLLIVFLLAIGVFSYVKYSDSRVPIPPRVTAPVARSEAPAKSEIRLAALMPQQHARHEPMPAAVNTDEGRTRLAEAATQALNAADPQERGQALAQLSAEQTPETLYALGQGLNDSVERNRYMSIDSLRLLAANQGDRDGAIRQLLRMAMNDRNREVASHAQAAYQEVAELAGSVD